MVTTFLLFLSLTLFPACRAMLERAHPDSNAAAPDANTYISAGMPAVDFGSPESAAPPRLVLTLQRQTPRVPPVAPDTIPAGLAAESNLRVNTPCVAGRMVRDAIVVAFAEGATQPQRQAAIDSVGGVVVGGARFFYGDGWYVVRIDDDGTGQGLCDAIDLLRTMPLVTFAQPFYVDFVTL